MNWKFWTWGDNRPKAPLQLETYQPTSALRAPSTAQRIEPIPHPIPRAQPVATIPNEVEDDEDEEDVDDEDGDEEEDDVAFPEFTQLSSFKTLNVPESYVKLALSLGCATPNIVRAKLERYFVEQIIPIADREDVLGWLNDRLDYINADYWYWRPLRAQDELMKTSWGEDEYDSDDPDCRIYDRQIPTRVLERVAKLIAEFGNNLHFYVSDFTGYDHNESLRADCFIMVFPANHTPEIYEDDENFYFIFDTWSKPGYEDAPKANQPLIANLPV